MTTPAASIAVIGGSGLYSLFDPEASESHRIATPYGPADVTIGELAGRTVAFLTRHGADHSVAPHLINYRANLWALASLGVKAILSSAAVGGVSPDYPPGSLVLTDQFIDRTHGRADTFYDRGSVQHLAAADPFCPALHGIARRALLDAGESVIPSGTVVVIQGPRFSTRAESVWFRAGGAHTVNMTLYPEVPLAAELNMGTVNLSFVTDSDAGLAPDADPDDAAASTGREAAKEEALSAGLVFTRLRAAQPRIVAAITAIIREIPEDYVPRELISADAVAAVLAREPVTRPRGIHSSESPAPEAATSEAPATV
jgi:5'-methylthioadenosine phosphorylase